MVGGGLWVILLLDCHSDTLGINLLSIPRVQHFIIRICQLKVFYLCPLPMIIPFCFLISYSFSFFRSYFGCLSHVISTRNISYPSPFITLFVIRISPTFAFYSHHPVFFNFLPTSFSLTLTSVVYRFISSAHMAFPSPFFALFSTRITPTFVSALRLLSLTSVVSLFLAPRTIRPIQIPSFLFSLLFLLALFAYLQHSSVCQFIILALSFSLSLRIICFSLFSLPFVLFLSVYPSIFFSPLIHDTGFLYLYLLRA